MLQYTARGWLELVVGTGCFDTLSPVRVVRVRLDIVLALSLPFASLPPRVLVYTRATGELFDIWI